jgi:hypothetical protein
MYPHKAYACEIPRNVAEQYCFRKFRLTFTQSGVSVLLWSASVCSQTDDWVLGLCANIFILQDFCSYGRKNADCTD